MKKLFNLFKCYILYWCLRIL